MKNIIWKVDTLTCPSCIKRIEKSLKKQKGVKTVEVKFNSSKVDVEFDETTISKDTITKILENLGYPVESTQEK